MRGWAIGTELRRRNDRWSCSASPAGGCSTGYFDLQVEGLDGYSMADAFVQRGAVVVAVDHPGIGASDEVADLFALTPSLRRRLPCARRAARSSTPCPRERCGPFPRSPARSWSGWVIPWVASW